MHLQAQTPDLAVRADLERAVGPVTESKAQDRKAPDDW
jgi:hypothetical protein